MRPVTETELAEVVRDAAGPLRIVGGGTRGIGPCSGEVLETGGLSGISLYEPGALTLVAGAGTPLAQVESVLAGERQRLAFEVPDLRGLLGVSGNSTLGGVVAANASGPRRVQVGACRDALLGVRFVDGRGAVIRNGGRVMKNVTGYDLVKLLAGSHGTLGVISEVAFKVQAVPEAEATLVKPGLTVAQALAALTRALGSPYDVTGAAFADGLALVRLEGMAGSVAYRSREIDRLLGGGWEAVSGADLWRGVRDVTAFAGKPGAVWRVSLRPSDAPGFVAALGSALGSVVADAIYDWGGGLVWLRLEEAGDHGLIRRLLAATGGHATLIRGSEALRRMVPAFQPEAPALAALTRGLRAQFDPRGILNPGRMG